jgi:hypothetical protein
MVSEAVEKFFTMAFFYVNKGMIFKGKRSLDLKEGKGGDVFHPSSLTIFYVILKEGGHL